MIPIKKLHPVVIIVYDGKSPEAAAKNLCDYLREIGQTASLWDSDKYRNNASSFPNVPVIIVGHHSLARNTLEDIGELKYDKFGMKFGFKDKLCVLRASKSEVELKEQSAFGEFYNERMRYYTELARKFGAAGNARFSKMEVDKFAGEAVDEVKEIFLDGDDSLSGVAAKAIVGAIGMPLFALCGVAYTLKKGIEVTMANRQRKKLRETQYDLLLLEFITYGLSQFLGFSGSQSPIEHEPGITENDIEEIVADLKRQMDAHKDDVICLDDVIKYHNAQNEAEGIKTLRKHLGNDIVFTGVWADATDEYHLKDDELLPGELSAVTFRIGCYTVRSAERVYHRERDGEDMAPVNNKEDLVYVKGLNASNSIRLFDPELKKKYYFTQEIMARHNSDPEGAFAGDFKYVCRSLGQFGFVASEDIAFICTLKEGTSLSDEHASLFVFIRYMGDSFSSESWYRLTPKGVVLHYSIHPYNSESFEASWRDI